VIVSFFNELDTGKRTMLRAPGSIPRLLVHFLTSFLQRGKLCSKLLFHFLTSFPQRGKTMLMTSVLFFNELATEKRNCSRGLSLIMASKRITLWKDTMSRDKTRSYLPRDRHWMEENHSGKNTCRGSHQG
jgi:hypothetical protein